MTWIKISHPGFLFFDKILSQQKTAFRLIFLKRIYIKLNAWSHCVTDEESCNEI